MATIKKSIAKKTVKTLQNGGVGNPKGYNPGTSPLPNTVTKGGYETTLDKAGSYLIQRDGNKKEISRALIGTKQEDDMRKSFSAQKQDTDSRRNDNLNFLKSRQKTGEEADKLKSGGSTKNKMKSGGSLSAINKSSSKKVGPIDPKGAFTKVQKKTLASAKGKASLTKDKKLGATKMAKCGTCISKKK